MNSFLLLRSQFLQRTFLLLFVSICMGQHSGAQTSTNQNREQQLADKGIQIHPDQLALLNDYDFSLLSSFDFNPYRNEKTTRLIQIKRGPVITIQPLQWMIAQQKQVDQAIVNKKQGEVLSSSTISTITLIDIGAGFKPLEKSEKWITE